MEFGFAKRTTKIFFILLSVSTPILRGISMQPSLSSEIIWGRLGITLVSPMYEFVYKGYFKASF